MKTMDLALETLDSIEAPLSEEFYEGLATSVAVIIAVGGVALAVAT
jgi:hypothetical protein